MNWTQIEGKWDQLKGDVKSKWAKLTDDDIKFVGGKLDKLVGKVIERYGVKKEQAHHQVNEWADRLEAQIGAIGRQAGEVLVQEFRQVAAQFVEVHATGAKHRRGVGVIGQAQEQMLQGRIFVASFAGER